MYEKCEAEASNAVSSLSNVATASIFYIDDSSKQFKSDGSSKHVIMTKMLLVYTRF